MSDLNAQKTEPEVKPSEQEDDEDSRTPFDHPLFLPILLFLAMLWFAYDGWFTTDEEMLQWQTFNRVGAGVLLFFTGMTLRSAFKEMARDRNAAPHSSSKE